MKKLNTTTLKNFRVAYVKAHGGPSGAKAAFDKLEAPMSTLKGRKLYGVFFASSGEYFACLGLETEYANTFGFETMVIPGGKYAKMTIQDWTARVNEISAAFGQLSEEIRKNGHSPDQSRPAIEFYRSQKELIIFQPIV